MPELKPGSQGVKLIESQEVDLARAGVYTNLQKTIISILQTLHPNFSPEQSTEIVMQAIEHLTESRDIIFGQAILLDIQEETNNESENSK